MSTKYHWYCFYGLNQGQLWYFSEIYDYIHRWNFVTYVHCIGFCCMEWMPLNNLFYKCTSPFSAKHIMPSTLDILVIWVILYIVLGYYKFDYHVPGISSSCVLHVSEVSRQEGFLSWTTYQTHTWHMFYIAVEYCPGYSGHHWDFHGISTCK